MALRCGTTSTDWTGAGLLLTGPAERSATLPVKVVR